MAGTIGKIKLGIVVSEFNADITEIMLERAKAHAEFLGVEVAAVFRVPGTYDIPFGVNNIIGKVDAVVTLGAVIEGETEHDEIVVQHAARKMLDLSIEHNKPVALGISGPGMSRIQGFDRADEYAKRAVETAVKLHKRKIELG